MVKYSYICSESEDTDKELLGFLNTEPDSKLNPEPLYTVKVPVSEAVVKSIAANLRYLNRPNGGETITMIGRDNRSVEIPIYEKVGDMLYCTHMVNIRGNPGYWATLKDAEQYPLGSKKGRAMLMRNSQWNKRGGVQWEFMDEGEVRHNMKAAEMAMELAIALKDDKNVFSAESFIIQHKGLQYQMRGEWYGSVSDCADTIRALLEEHRKVFIYDVQPIDGKLFTHIAIGDKGFVSPGITVNG